jgi:hypothetical protein
MLVARRECHSWIAAFLRHFLLVPDQNKPANSAARQMNTLGDGKFHLARNNRTAAADREVECVAGRATEWRFDRRSAADGKSLPDRARRLDSSGLTPSFSPP